jgi:hypothetical protein
MSTRRLFHEAVLAGCERTVIEAWTRSVLRASETGQTIFSPSGGRDPTDRRC